jgi:hypothetical protein
MIYACDDPLYEIFREREDNEDLIGDSLGFVETNISTTAEAVEACNTICGKGKWKRRWKKTISQGYGQYHYRVMEDTESGKFVTVVSSTYGYHQDPSYIFEGNLKDHWDTIEKVLEYSIKHYVEIDGGDIFYNPFTKSVFYSFSDCFAFYVEDSSNKKEVEKAAELAEEDPYDWIEDTDKQVQTHVDGLGKVFYGDEWSPDIVNAYLPIGALTQYED